MAPDLIRVTQSLGLVMAPKMVADLRDRESVARYHFYPRILQC